MASGSAEIRNEMEIPVEEDDTTPLPSFPPLTKSHIMNCSYHSWHPKYRSVTPKARLVPLTPEFLSYLRADGIVLPPEDTPTTTPRREWSDDDSGIFSSTEQGGSDDGSNDEDDDPSAEWRDVHQAIKATIAELGGKVHPKLNWSAPKDATWISATNSMECRTPNDIYLLLKSSDFATHDLEHAFDDCESDTEDVTGESETQDTEGVENEDPTESSDLAIPYHLVLRKSVLFNPSLEFRCFVRDRRLLRITQRDLNHFDFLFPLRPRLVAAILDFFTRRLQHTFPDPDFAFDVYIPPPHDRVWLIDVNPWAVRTDPLLFSWEELLTGEHAEVAEMPAAPADLVAEGAEGPPTPLDIIRAHIASRASSTDSAPTSASTGTNDTGVDDADADILSPTALLPHLPELRLVSRDDPEAYNFSTAQYSAHKLPRDVVDASRSGGSALMEFAERWREVVQEEEARQRREDEEAATQSTTAAEEDGL